ncbi:MAG: LamG domain-containing protein [Candidatus Hinthialibacter antarcticus]|nr:LamG domain-containing protein [Candidatus Hinthialibacter antarcticus]
MTNKFRKAVLAMAVCAFALPSYAQAPDPVIGFDFDEGSGESVMDLSGQHEGVFGITPNPDAIVEIVDDTPSGAAGDTAVFFSGNEVLIGSTDAQPFLDLETSPVTVELWVKATDLTETYMDFFRYGNSLKMGISSGNFIFTHLAVADYPSGVPVEVDVWHHAAAVFEPEVGITFYLDGEEAAFVATTNFPRVLQNSTFVMGGAGNSSFYTGYLDRFRIHNAVLTAGELDSVADAPKAMLDSTIASYDFSSFPAENAAATEVTLTPQETTILQSSYPEWGAGPTGQPGDFALYFNGENARVSVQDPEDAFQLDLDLTFTLEAYVKYEDQPNTRAIVFSYGVPGTGGYSFSVTTDPRKVFVTTYGILDADNESVIPDDSGWHHIAVVHDTAAAELRFYVDGELGDTLEYTGGVNFSVDRNALYIGVEGRPGSNAAGLPYKGYIDRVRVHTSVLAPEQFSIVEVADVSEWSIH